MEHKKAKSLWANRCAPRDFLQDRQASRPISGRFRCVHASQLSPRSADDPRAWPQSLSGWTLLIPKNSEPQPPPNTAGQASWLPVLKEISSGAVRSMRFWDKLGRMQLCAMDQIQVNIPLLLLLVAVKVNSDSGLCVSIWGLQPGLCGQHCAGSQATRQPALRLSPAEVEQCAVHYLTLLSLHPGERTRAIHRETQGHKEHRGKEISVS